MACKNLPLGVNTRGLLIELPEATTAAAAATIAEFSDDEVDS